MQCHFGQLRNGSVATHLIHFSSTATSSALREYVTVPEHIGRKEKPAGGNEERTKNKSSFVPKQFLKDTQQNYMYVFNM